MHGIMAMSSELISMDLPRDTKESAQIIHDCAEHLMSLLTNILDLARFKSGKLNLEQIPFHLPREVEKVSSLLSANAKQKGLSVSADISLRHSTRIGIG